MWTGVWNLLRFGIQLQTLQGTFSLLPNQTQYEKSKWLFPLFDGGWTLSDGLNYESGNPSTILIWRDAVTCSLRHPLLFQCIHYAQLPRPVQKCQPTLCFSVFIVWALRIILFNLPSISNVSHWNAFNNI